MCNSELKDLQPLILVVDDDKALARMLSMLLKQAGAIPTAVNSAEDAIKELKTRPYDLVLSDLQMPGMNGLDLLNLIHSTWSDLPVLIITGHGTIDSAVEAMRCGATSFLMKPFDREQIIFEIRRALQNQLENLPTALRDFGLIGSSQEMQDVFELVQRAASSTTNVLVRGESGTGKEKVVDAIHLASRQSEGPLIKVHCGSVPDSLIKDELFGHEKGAFTGATNRRVGRIELAQNGTLFLDEIGDISSSVQVALLRVLQERTYERLGGNDVLSTNSRFIAATHRDLESYIEDGLFREDLFYRLNVIPIWIPPLRERIDDIEPLVLHFSEVFAAEHERDVKWDPQAMDIFRRYPWPGNVRELRNTVERITVLSSKDYLDKDMIQAELNRATPSNGFKAFDDGNDELKPRPKSLFMSDDISSLDDTLRETEKKYLIEMLDRCKGNRTQAARISGVSRRTFYNLLERHGLDL